MSRSDEDFRREIEAHIPLETDRLVRDGMSPADARDAARRRFGGALKAQERFYESRRRVRSSAFARELAHACRMLARDRAFTAVALLTLSLGVAGAATLFSVAVGVLLEPLPWAESDRLIRVVETRQGRSGRIPNTISNGTFLAWSEDPTTIEKLAGWRDAAATLAGAGEPHRVSVAWVTPSLFAVLRAHPHIGRVFTEEEGAVGAPGVTVLGFGLWQERFGGGPDAIGRVVQLDGRPHTVVGVMPQSFQFPDRSVRAWVPWSIPPVVAGQGVLRGVILQAIARLDPGVTPAQAAAEATARARSAPDAAGMAVALFGARGPIDVSATPALEALTADVAPAIAVLFAGVALLLAVATANVASLHLTRALRRRRELAIRAAIGADSGHLVRHVLIECVALGLAVGAAAVVVTRAAIALLPHVVTSDIPRLDNVALDWRGGAFTLAVALGASSLAGLLPILQARGVKVSDWLAVDGSASTGSRWRAPAARASGVLMTVQVGLACALLAGAVLFSRSLLSMMRAERGYDPVNVLSARVPFPSGYTDAQRVAAMERLAARLAQTMGIESAGFGNALPLVSAGGFFAFRVPSGSEPGGQIEGEAARRVVSAGYFDAMRLRVVAGRPLTPADDAGSPPVMVVNRSFVRRYLPHLDLVRWTAPTLRDVGVRFLNSAPSGVEIVGVVEDMRQDRVDAAPQPEVFFSYKQISPALVSSEPAIVARTPGDPAAHAATLRTLVAEIDPMLALDSIMSMDQRVSASLARPRAYAVLLVGFASAALVIAGVGLFGALAYTIAHRSRELAVRVALGATTRDVLRTVLAPALTVTVAGLVAGLALSIGLGSYLTRFLYGVSPHDPPSLATVGFLVALMSLAACVVPVRRATRVDPAVTLRCE